MSPLAFLAAASAPRAPLPTVSAWGRLKVTWTGWDGTVWDLSHPFGESGVFLTKGGTRGLHMPPVQRYSDSSPGAQGSHWRGFRAEERDVFWPLYLYSEVGSEHWVAVDRAFWATMRPDKTGVWSVTTPGGGTRTLRCRWVGGDDSSTHDPTHYGWAVYGVNLVAEQPYWEGKPDRRTWKTANGVDFFNAAAAPPFRISPGSTLASARMRNPGDVEAYPVWTVTGPTTSVEVGVGGRIIEVPIELGEGETLTIDTRPTEQYAWDQSGADRTSDLGAVDFAPIEPGASVELSLDMVGTGSVSAEITPLYYRAW